MRFGWRQLIFVLVLLMMPVAAYFSVFKPRNAQIAEAQGEIQRKLAKLRQLEQATRSIEDLGREIEKLAGAIEMFEQKLPAEREVEVVLQQVWELASKHGLTPKSVRTDRPVTSSQYSELPIKMVIVGDFDGFYSFLIDLEKLRRITRMPQMKLSKHKTQEGQMQGEVRLSIFYESRIGPTATVGDRS